MDANWSSKSTVAAVNFDHARISASGAAVAPTVLPAEETVQATAESASVRNDITLLDKATKGEVLLDPHSHQVIYRVRDADSRQVLWQIPDMATLRLRAYARATAPIADQIVLHNTDVEA